MYITLYIFYAVVQAILVARYTMNHDNDTDNILFCVGLMAVAAPITSVIAFFVILQDVIVWLVTYKRK